MFCSAIVALGIPTKHVASQSLVLQVMFCSVRGHRRGRAAGGLVSIPCSSGHVLQRALRLSVDAEEKAVSIPCSSGHVLQPTNMPSSLAPTMSESQSLVLQVMFCSIDLAQLEKLAALQVSIPCSSGHVLQPTSDAGGRGPAAARVSIPCSSGHVLQQRQRCPQGPLQGRVSIPCSSGHVLQPGEQPQHHRERWSQRVSIPCSSGHVLQL